MGICRHCVDPYKCMTLGLYLSKTLAHVTFFFCACVLWSMHDLPVDMWREETDANQEQWAHNFESTFLLPVEICFWRALMEKVCLLNCFTIFCYVLYEVVLHKSRPLLHFFAWRTVKVLSMFVEKNHSGKFFRQCVSEQVNAWIGLVCKKCF